MSLKPCVSGLTADRSIIRCGFRTVVFATIPGYLAVVQVWNGTRWFGLGCYPEHRGTNWVRGRVGTGLQFHIMVPATLASMKYLSSDLITTQSV